MRQITIKLDEETIEKLDKIVYVLKAIGFKDITRSDIIREGINYIIKNYYTLLDIDNLYSEYKMIKTRIRGVRQW